MSDKAVEQRRQERWVVIAAVVIVIVSVLTTLYFSGALSQLRASDVTDQYNNITFTDAVISCKEQTRSEYKRVLRRLVLDDHSSRFDQAENTYKIFFNAQMSSNKTDAGESEFFINCYVGASSGQIADYQVYENKESATEAIRKNSGGLFGWPRAK